MCKKFSLFGNKKSLDSYTIRRNDVKNNILKEEFKKILKWFQKGIVQNMFEKKISIIFQNEKNVGKNWEKYYFIILPPI